MSSKKLYMVTLYCHDTAANHDKVYSAWIEQEDGTSRWFVVTEYGRRGGHMTLRRHEAAHWNRHDAAWAKDAVVQAKCQRSYVRVEQVDPLAILVSEAEAKHEKQA